MAEDPKRRQRRAAATSDQLMQAARAVFETDGYQAATVGAITRAANTAHGTFYLYFRNKQDAFAKVMNDICARMYEEAQAPWAEDPATALRTSIHGFLEVFSAHRGLWRALLQGALQDPEIERMWMELRRPFIDRIEVTLGHRRDIGMIRPLDTTVSAHALGSMVEWFAFTHFVMAEPSEAVIPVDRVVDGLVDLWLHAVYTDTAGPLAPLPVGQVAPAGLSD